MSQTRFVVAKYALCAVGLLLIAIVPGAHAQKRLGGLVPAAVAPAVAKGEAKAKAADEAVDAMQEKSEKDFPGGAALKTDPEQQRLLKRAEQCVADGRLDLAAVLWQKVLDEAGDTLMTRDGRTYTSLAEEVERMLSTAPEGADLRSWRY